MEDARRLGNVKICMLGGSGGGSDVHGIPAGGTVRQVLAKNSSTNYDAEWKDPTEPTIFNLAETNIQTVVGTPKTVRVSYYGGYFSLQSSDTSVATVSATTVSDDGNHHVKDIVITPVANGACTVILSVTPDDDFDFFGGKAYINITVGASSGGGKQTTIIDLSESNVVLDESLTDTVTVTYSGAAATFTSSDTSVATVDVTSASAVGNTYTYVITITAKKEGACSIEVNVPENSSYYGAKAYINVTVAISIYGAEWDGSSSPVWTRTDMATNFVDPVPYYSGMSGTPSSPFDDIMPWKGMRRVTDAAAGELVEIPKFYYKWTRSGSSMKLQISMKPFTGSHVSPAHADRGDGVGERDYVYVGRYHCASDYKSTTGVKPTGNITRATARSGIHNLASDIWQYDYAMYWTIMMLYLVEFADWNSQAKIGYGCGNNSATENMGSTDSMQYHTGTNASSRTTYGHTQYRHIEDLWGNVYDWVDGIYFAGTSNADVYCIKNPASFSDSSGGTSIGTRATSSGYIKGWTSPSVSGFEYALYPNSVDSSLDSSLDGATYICDYCDYTPYSVVLYVGGSYNHFQRRGAFYLSGDYSDSDKYGGVGSRLQKLPS